jgi:hypothetical protein
MAPHITACCAVICVLLPFTTLGQGLNGNSTDPLLASVLQRTGGGPGCISTYAGGGSLASPSHYSFFQAVYGLAVSSGGVVYFSTETQAWPFKLWSNRLSAK